MSVYDQSLRGEKSFLMAAELKEGFYSDVSHCFEGTNDLYVPAMTKSNILFAFDPHFSSSFFTIIKNDTIRILIPGIYLISTTTEFSSPSSNTNVNVHIYINGERHATQGELRVNQNPQRVTELLFIEKPSLMIMQTNNMGEHGVTVSSSRLFLSLISRL
jgi:hypothetical protein